MRSLAAAVGTAAALLLLALSGCSSPEGDAAADPLPETVSWAGAVCSDVAEVRTAVSGIGDALAINPLSGTGALDEARRKIETQANALGAALDGLRAQIAAAPDDPAAQEARSALEEAIDAVESTTDAAGSQAQAALNADSVPAAVSAAGGALGAVREALGAIGDLVRAATGTTSGASAEVRAAFAQAPACQDLG